MKTKKFGVGDKVKILHCSDMMLIGQITEVASICGTESNRYFVEVDVHAVQNVKYNNDRVWMPQCKVMKMDLLLQPWELTLAENEIEMYYDGQRKICGTGYDSEAGRNAMV